MSFIDLQSRQFLMKFCENLAISVSAESYEKILPSVIGGSNTVWGQFPASVFIDTPNDFCGGSVIDDLHVN